jgi:hypothetical protein
MMFKRRQMLYSDLTARDGTLSGGFSRLQRLNIYRLNGTLGVAKEEE